MPYSDVYDPDEDFDRWFTDGTAAAIGRWIRPGDAVLELGCATGRMSAVFTAMGATVTGVDIAAPYLARARGRRLDNATFVQSDILEVRFDQRFDHVIMANVVHEVADPAVLFEIAGKHVADAGYVHVSLQNPRSIHRTVGMEMGLIADPTELSELGRRYGTVRILDVPELEQLGRAAGLEPIHRQGVMLKPLPNDLMATLPKSVLEGLLAAARHYPELSAMNYLVFRGPAAVTASDG